MKLALFCGYLVTANKDGSIPLNSGCIAKVEPNQEANEIMEKMVELYNAQVS